MSVCEKCWGHAYILSLNEPMKDQSEHYRDLVNDVSRMCTADEQMGQWKCRDCGQDGRCCGCTVSTIRKLAEGKGHQLKCRVRGEPPVCDCILSVLKP